MIRHTQRDFGKEHGSCFATAIASVLDLPLAAVPNFALFLRWPEALDMWCRQRGIVWHQWHANQERRMCARCHSNDAPGDGLCRLPIPTAGLVVAGGKSPRANGDGLRHAVVWDAALDRLAHDPHPDGTGLVGAPEGWSWFARLESA